MAIITKKKLNEFLSLSEDPTIDLLDDTEESYSIMIKGAKDKMKKSNSQLILEELKKINSRLDVLEDKVDLIMECPTIKKELSTLPNKK